MALLVTIVLGDVVKVLTADDNGTLHLGGHNDTSQDTALNVDLTGERALLVNVVAKLSLLGGLEAKTNILEPAAVALGGVLGVLEDVGLLLEGLLGLENNCMSPTLGALTLLITHVLAPLRIRE